MSEAYRCARSKLEKNELTGGMCLILGYCQLTIAPRPCGPSTITPTGPIIPIGRCVVPAIIKPLITPSQPMFSSQPFLPCPPSPHCQPMPPCPSLPPLQPLPPCPPTPPSPPPHHCIPQKLTPRVEDDVDEDLDKILYLLMNNILENRKQSGKKSGSGKGTDSDSGIDSSNNNVECGDDYEYILPSPYPTHTPAFATFYPHGAGALATAASPADAGFSLPASDNGYAPEICLTFRPYPENCL